MPENLRNMGAGNVAGIRKFAVGCSVSELAFAVDETVRSAPKTGSEDLPGRSGALWGCKVIEMQQIPRSTLVLTVDLFTCSATQ